MLQQLSDPTMTLADFWEIYKADMEKRLRKTTMKQKEYVMNDKVLPYFGKTPINEITAPMIRKWQGEMMEKGFKPTYLKTIHNQLSAILNYAVNFYDLRSNPCRKAGSMGKSKADERPYWTLEEFQKFSDAIMDKQDSWIAFQILFWTGMRIGELLALQVKDIDFEQGTITVDESLTRFDGEDLITAPKTESSVRVIMIHKELQEELKEYIATLYHVRPGTRLFAGRTKSFFEHEMERGIKMSGVKKITVHCTRHSHASMLVQFTNGAWENGVLPTERYFLGETELGKAYDEIWKTPYLAYTMGWKVFAEMLQFGLILGSILIICGVSTIFAEESQTKMLPLIFSTEEGRRKDVPAKILASFTFTIFIFMWFVLVNLVLCWMIYGLKGFENISWMVLYQHMLQPVLFLKYLGILLGLAFQALLSLCAIALCVSAYQDSSFGAVIIAAVCWGLPVLIRMFFGGIIWLIVDSMPIFLVMTGIVNDIYEMWYIVLGINICFAIGCLVKGLVSYKTKKFA